MLFVKIRQTFDEHFQQTHTTYDFMSEFEHGVVDVSFLEDNTNPPADYDGITYNITSDSTEYISEDLVDFNSRWPAEDMVYVDWEQLRDIYHADTDDDSSESTVSSEIVTKKIE